MDNVINPSSVDLLALTRPVGVTYLAGCTDSDYEDSSCPDKGDFSDQTWAGLVYCNGTSNEWVACEDDGSTVSVPSTCWCPSTSRTVAFTDASRLTNIMSLPANLGDSVTWEDVTAYASAHSLDSSSPSTAPSSRTTERGLTTLLPPASASTGPDPPATSIPAPTSTPSETAHSPSATPSSLSPISGLDVAQKIGIAFGSVGGAAVILLLAWLVFGCMRRRKRDLRPEPPVPEPVEPLTETAYVDPEMRSPAWSGHKSELPADESTIASPSTGFHEFPRPQSVEVEGSPVLVSPARPTQDGGFRIPGHKGTYYEMAG